MKHLLLTALLFTNITRAEVLCTEKKANTEQNSRIQRIKKSTYDNRKNIVIGAGLLFITAAAVLISRKKATTTPNILDGNGANIPDSGNVNNAADAAPALSGKNADTHDTNTVNPMSTFDTDNVKNGTVGFIAVEHITDGGTITALTQQTTDGVIKNNVMVEKNAEGNDLLNIDHTDSQAALVEQNTEESIKQKKDDNIQTCNQIAQKMYTSLKSDISAVSNWVGYKYPTPQGKKNAREAFDKATKNATALITEAYKKYVDALGQSTQIDGADVRAIAVNALVRVLSAEKTETGNAFNENFIYKTGQDKTLAKVDMYF